MLAQHSFRYSHTIGFYAVRGGRGFNNPVDMAIGPNKVIYVLNRAGPDYGERLGSKRVTMCTVEEEYLGQFSTGGTEDGEIMWPVSIAIDNEGKVYISDEALHRISTFDENGRYLRKWGLSGNKDGEFNGPSGIAFDQNDNLLIVDSRNSRIQRYTKDGQFLGGWGHEGDGDGEFNLPWGICVDRSGAVYVADWGNDRVQKFNSHGTHLATWETSGGVAGQLNRPAGVDVDREGNVYIADWGNERVQVMGADGRFQLMLRGQATLSKWAEEYFASNPEERQDRDISDLTPTLPEHLNTPYHISSQTEPYFWGPISVTVDGAGRLYVTETNRHRFQVYQKP